MAARAERSAPPRSPTAALLHLSARPGILGPGERRRGPGPARSRPLAAARQRTACPNPPLPPAPGQPQPRGGKRVPEEHPAPDSLTGISAART